MLIIDGTDLGFSSDVHNPLAQNMRWDQPQTNAKDADLEMKGYSAMHTEDRHALEPSSFRIYDHSARMSSPIHSFRIAGSDIWL